LPLLVGLCLLDLGFVHATGVVDLLWLLPMWALAALAPFLRRLQRHRLHRFLWNGFVLVVFALLVQHATTSGLLHMLEDGLVLAVLCQVHLLNNVGERQRPDLVFFNSFLIAFVTSFFAPDAIWSLLFVAHAFVLVPGLQLHCLTRAVPATSARPLRELLRGSMRRTLAIGLATALAFVALPRDFRRQGWLGDAFGQQALGSGLAERIQLDDEHAHKLDDEIVLTIQPGSSQGADVPTHWRTTAFTWFDGSSWAPQDAAQLGSRLATDKPFERQPDGSLGRAPARADLATAAWRVSVADLGQGRVPLPLHAIRVQPLDTDELLLDPRSDGGVRVLSRTDSDLRGLTFVATTTNAVARVRPSPRVREVMTQLPERVPTVVTTLAQQLRAAQPTDADELTIAAGCADWLQQNRRYQLPGAPGFARNLGDFLLGGGAGHCEYFATALALLLRVQGVPCRLVGGWLAFETLAGTNKVVVRGKHAHAWVEVLAADGTWHTVDPTPAADGRTNATDTASAWAALHQRLDAIWRTITGFDQDARARWLDTLLHLPTRHPWVLATLLAAVAAVVYLRRRQRQTVPTIVELHRASRAAGLSLHDGETPRELLGRAAASGLAPAVLTRLHAAAEAHERTRYAGQANGTP
jgi:transglutaminase-like putative cysteine protease